MRHRTVVRNGRRVDAARLNRRRRARIRAINEAWALDDEIDRDIGGPTAPRAPRTGRPPTLDRSPIPLDDPPGWPRDLLVTPPPQRRPTPPEPKPWVLTNPDGTLNVGSYGYMATVSMVELAYELILSRGPVDDLAAALRKVKTLAKVLLEAADQAQTRINPTGRVDRMEMSHSRARGAVRTALRALPVPWDATAVDRALWAQQLADHAADILLLTHELYRTHQAEASA